MNRLTTARPGLTSRHCGALLQAQSELLRRSFGHYVDEEAGVLDSGNEQVLNRLQSCLGAKVANGRQFVNHPRRALMQFVLHAETLSRELRRSTSTARSMKLVSHVMAASVSYNRSRANCERIARWPFGCRALCAASRNDVS